MINSCNKQIIKSDKNFDLRKHTKVRLISNVVCVAAFTSSSHNLLKLLHKTLDLCVLPQCWIDRPHVKATKTCNQNAKHLLKHGTIILELHGRALYKATLHHKILEAGCNFVLYDSLSSRWFLMYPASESDETTKKQD